MAHVNSRRRAAIVGSFAVYLVPLVGPHAFWFLGEALVAGFGSGRPWAWRGVELVVAVLVQGATWLVLRWSLGGASVRKLSWLAAIPLVGGLNLAYQVAIPSYFLIEPDTALETTTWAEHCFVPDVSLMSVRTGVNQPAAGARAWWTQTPDAGYRLLRLPGCSTTDTAMPTPTLQPGGHVDFFIGLHYATSTGAVVVERTVPSTGRGTWFLLADPWASLQPLDPPGEVDSPPIISNSGDTVAWMQRVAGSARPVLQRVLVRRMPNAPPIAGADVDVELAPLGPASYTLIDVDAAAREVTLWRNDRPVVVGFNGQAHPLAFDADAVRPQSSTYLRLNTGWVAWDAYRDEGPYQLAWAIGARAGSRRTNAGRTITSAAVDPTGAFIAVSETTALSIGSARDVVWVARTDTGAEVFRKYLPRYARSPVVFFEGGLFGYSDLEGTHVLKMGADAQ